MLALIAGSGQLPTVLADKPKQRPVIAALDGFAPDDLKPDITFRIEQLGSFFKELAARGVREVCFAGAIRRPALDPNLVDGATMPLVPRMVAALQSGDDAALRTVMAFFEEAGFVILGAHDIAPDLLPPVGLLTENEPSPEQVTDATRAEQVLSGMAVADIGQSCVIHRGQVLAMEGVFGTDWMLQSLAQRPDDAGGLFFKAPKPGQDVRIDMPTIGLQTVLAVASAKLMGIVIEAAGVLVLDQDATLRAANRAGLFIWVREP